MASLNEILDDTKQYEYLRDKHDPAYNALIDAIEVVKDFIQEHKLVIYGGSAIDFALRLKGDKIYSDEALAVPDLDCYSPDSVEHAYTLADILWRRGYGEVRTIVARYVRTMRVDLMDGHFIADITYCPPDVFGRLPTLVYNGMRIIHPDYQRIDLHSSLSFPYDNPPMEVIFDRWGKDIKRFNLLNKYYPMTATGPTKAPALRQFVVPTALADHILTGFAGFGIIRHVWEQLMAGTGPDLGEVGRAAKVDGDMTIETYNDGLDIVSFDPEHAVPGLTSWELYEPYFGATWEQLRAQYSVEGRPPVNLTIHSTHNRLISINYVKFGERNIKIVNVQAMLRHFAGLANINTGGLRRLYVAHYNALLTMIESAAAHVPADQFLDSPLAPSVYVYGKTNESLAYLATLNRLLVDLREAEPWLLPRNYHPGRSIPNEYPHPIFVYESNEHFRESGKVIKKTIS